MRFFTLLALLLMTVCFCPAQNATPNAGFENWTLNNKSYYTPDNWSNLDTTLLGSFLGVLTCIRDTSAHSGTYAAKLITKVVNLFGSNDTANGVITSGHLVTSPPYGVNGGIPYALRPDSMVGWYKYYPTKGDSTDIEFTLFTSASDSIGMASFTTGDSATSYKRFSRPIIYFSSGTPDSSRWLISSSNGYFAKPNSTLYIDDIGLVFKGNGGINTVYNNSDISVFPNPTNGYVTVFNPKSLQGSITIYDEAGRQIKVLPLEPASMIIDMHELSDGNYFYSIKDKNSKYLAEGTIVLKQ